MNRYKKIKYPFARLTYERGLLIAAFGISIVFLVRLHTSLSQPADFFVGVGVGYLAISVGLVIFAIIDFFHGGTYRDEIESLHELETRLTKVKDELEGLDRHESLSRHDEYHGGTYRDEIESINELEVRLVKLNDELEELARNEFFPRHDK